MTTPARGPSPIDTVAEEYVVRLAELDPLVATTLGLPGHDDELPDLSPAGHLARAEAAMEAVARVAATDAVDDVDAQTPGLPEAAVACIACHGTVGANMLPVPPVLSGQHRDYLVHALGQYQAQERGMVVMNSFAAGLTQEQIEQITRFYSSREGLDTLDENQ